MKLDIGIIASVVGALIFYTRLTWVQRRAARAGAKSTKPIKNWIFLVLGIVMICAGALFASLNLLPELKTYWWIPVTLGFIVLCFAV